MEDEHALVLRGGICNTEGREAVTPLTQESSRGTAKAAMIC